MTIKPLNELHLWSMQVILPANGNKSSILQTRNLGYTYPGQAAIHFPDLDCPDGETLLITGNSGTGKTTLLHLLCGLLKTKQGEVILKGQNLADLSQRDLDRFRGKHIGLVFQQPRFIAALNVMDNVLAAQYFGTGRNDNKFAEALLEELDIARYKRKDTGQLSGGERQRLAIACALSTKPAVVMADEPTSSLDDANAEVVYALIRKECEANGAALLVVSHDQRLKEKFDKRVTL